MAVVSVVLPTYNRADLVPRAIASVLAQTLTALELIVVDDGSTDDTAAVVAAITDPRVSYLYQDNSGVSAARNAGARVATGCYLAFLDSDDEVLPHWLERLAAELDIPQTGVASCGVQVWAEGESTPQVSLPKGLGLLGSGQKGQFLSLSFAVRREIFWAAGGYDERLHYAENTELSWRLLETCTAQGWRSAHIDEALGIYRPARTGGARHLRNLDRSLASYEVILSKHRQRLSNHPRVYALYWSIAGVTAARLGGMDKARSCFREAVRWDGRNPRHRLRLLLTYVPVVRERFWLRHYG